VPEMTLSQGALHQFREAFVILCVQQHIWSKHMIWAPSFGGKKTPQQTGCGARLHPVFSQTYDSEKSRPRAVLSGDDPESGVGI
jgi:hypothetical protein